MWYIYELYFFLCRKTMDFPKNNNGPIDLKKGPLSMSVILSKNNCQTFPKIGSGNKLVTLSYKSWNFGPICARYGWNGCGVCSYEDKRDSYLVAILDKIECLTVGFWCQAICTLKILTEIWHQFWDKIDGKSICHWNYFHHHFCLKTDVKS